MKAPAGSRFLRADDGAAWLRQVYGSRAGASTGGIPHLLRLVAVTLGLMAAVAMAAALVVLPHAHDTAAYFDAGLVDPYRLHLKTQHGAFIYSPAITQVLEPIRLFGVQVMYALIVTATLVVLAYCTGPLLVAVLLFGWATPELWYGQINLILVGAALVGFRHPWAWALVLLTKVTPGVGVLWFAFRREWRQFGIALGATAAIAAVSFALAPHLWFAWAGVLLDNARTPMPDIYFPVPLWFRLVLAVALLAWAAPRNHRWAVPVAMTLGTAWLAPVHLLMLVGVLPLVRSRRWSAGRSSARLRPAFLGSSR